jgi:hypothetical protein
MAVQPSPTVAPRLTTTVPIPAAEILRSDMKTLSFPPKRFDGLVAFYSIAQ